MTEMYACKTATGIYELRQTRYIGKSHPHDVCAVARSADELRNMTARHWPDADFSRVAADLSDNKEPG